jgi:DNA-binding beta-propeller fold protein YncE
MPMSIKNAESPFPCVAWLNVCLVLTVAVAGLTGMQARAQNLFATDGSSIYQFDPYGVRSTFASGLSNPILAFDRVGDLFAADRGSGNIYKFNRAGIRTTFATGFTPWSTRGIAFNSSGDFFVADSESRSIYEFTSRGVRSTFAAGLYDLTSLAFDAGGNLFLGDNSRYGIYKYTPSGVESWFAAPRNGARSLAFDSSGTLFVGGEVGDLYFAPWSGQYVLGYSGTIETFRPNGVGGTFIGPSLYPSLQFGVNSLAFGGQGYLFATSGGNIYAYAPNGDRGAFATGTYNSIALQPLIPEPSVTSGLLVIGITGLVLCRWRRAV